MNTYPYVTFLLHLALQALNSFSSFLWIIDVAFTDINVCTVRLQIHKSPVTLRFYFIFQSLTYLNSYLVSDVVIVRF